MCPTLPTVLLTLLPLTLAANIPITVGDSATRALMFNPSAVPADVGDTLIFSYYPQNHSVVQSSFLNPCHPLASGGFFSGFQPLSAGPGPVEFVVQVNDTDPIWIYCSQMKGSPCQNGMAMVVNEPAPGSPNTLDAYQLAAAKTGNSTSPRHIAGGIFISRNSTSTTGQNSTASSTGSSSVASSSSGSYNSSGTGSSSRTGSSGSGAGSGAGSGSGTTTATGRGTKAGSGSGSSTSSSSTTVGTSQTSPIARFKDAASKTVTEFSIVCGAAAFFVFSLF